MKEKRPKPSDDKPAKKRRALAQPTKGPAPPRRFFAGLSSEVLGRFIVVCVDRFLGERLRKAQAERDAS